MKEQSGPGGEMGTGGMQMESAGPSPRDGQQDRAPQRPWNERQFSQLLPTWAGALDKVQRHPIYFSMLRPSAGYSLLCLLFPSKTFSFI